MTKPREIVARGLTASAKGSVIEFDGKKVRITDVKYMGNHRTEVHYENVVSLSNNQKLVIWDD